MKNILKYIAGCIAGLTITACGDIYEVHEQYITEGERTYIGHADTVYAQGGFNKVNLVWKLNVDPRIETCVITWNGCETPVEIPVNRSVEYMNHILEIPEGQYIFSLKMRSKSGEESLTETVEGESYGALYQARLTQRIITSILATPEKGVTIEWNAEEGCKKTVLSYININGEKKTVVIPETETTTIITDYVMGSEYEYYSAYTPEINAYEDINSLSKKGNFPAHYTLSKSEWDNTYHVLYEDIDRTGWLVTASTEELEGEGATNGRAIALIDGNLKTFWHSQYKGEGANPPCPHDIILDMQHEQEIISVELARREKNKDTREVEFSISNDGITWSLFGSLTFPNNANPNSQILLLPTAVKGRYLKVSVVNSNNGVNASIAEIMFTAPPR